MSKTDGAVKLFNELLGEGGKETVKKRLENSGKDDGYIDPDILNDGMIESSIDDDKYF